MTTPQHTFFIAHAGADKARARQLRDLLHPDVTTFLDVVDLLPGDEWDLALARAQRAARATVVLVPAQLDPAYYLREEIASAIAYQRADAERHRLIPVYLDGLPADPARIPYGLRVRHALDARELGLPGVADELRRVAAALEAPGAPPQPPPPPPPPVDRNQLYDALCGLLDAQFEELLFRVSAPAHELSPKLAPRTLRALDLIQWAEGAGTATFDALVERTRKLAPARLSS